MVAGLSKPGQRINKKTKSLSKHKAPWKQERDRDISRGVPAKIHWVAFAIKAKEVILSLSLSLSLSQSLSSLCVCPFLSRSHLIHNIWSLTIFVILKEIPLGLDIERGTSLLNQQSSFEPKELCWWRSEVPVSIFIITITMTYPETQLQLAENTCPLSPSKATNTSNGWSMVSEWWTNPRV